MPSGRWTHMSSRWTTVRCSSLFSCKGGELDVWPGPSLVSIWTNKCIMNNQWIMVRHPSIISRVKDIINPLIRDHRIHVEWLMNHGSTFIIPLDNGVNGSLNPSRMVNEPRFDVDCSLIRRPLWPEYYITRRRSLTATFIWDFFLISM